MPNSLFNWFLILKSFWIFFLCSSISFRLYLLSLYCLYSSINPLWKSSTCLMAWHEWKTSNLSMTKRPHTSQKLAFSIISWRFNINKLCIVGRYPVAKIPETPDGWPDEGGFDPYCVVSVLMHACFESWAVFCVWELS